MPCMLLLGAGFSRNWGGWLATEAFEYLLGCPEITANPFLSDLLWRSQQSGGFENALAELQVMAQRDPARGSDLQVLQGAIGGMFNLMNNGFERLQNFEPAAGDGVRRFLTRFDAIFTLNQDLLLEYQYLSLDVGLLSNAAQRRRLAGSEFPGMRPLNDMTQFPWRVWVNRWAPRPEEEFRVEPGFQPVIKLHGSSNWQQNNDGGAMLIMGGNKAREIGLVPVLQWYQQLFREYLCRGDTRLMVIGYGFRDDHINEVIVDAVNNHGLKLFVVSPDGADHARKIAPTRGAVIVERTALEDAFQRGVTGASRRSLHETFNGRETIELSKLYRFTDA